MDFFGKLFRKFFYKEPYICCMEMHNQFSCYCSIEHPCPPAGEGGAKEFFEKYHFAIIHNMFDPEWEEKIQLEEIYKKLILIYEFKPDEKNLQIVYKEHDRVYLPDKKFIFIPSGGIFIYDKTKIDIKF